MTCQPKPVIFSHKLAQIHQTCNMLTCEIYQLSGLVVETGVQTPVESHQSMVPIAITKDPRARHRCCSTLPRGRTLGEMRRKNFTRHSQYEARFVSPIQRQQLAEEFQSQTAVQRAAEVRELHDLTCIRLKSDCGGPTFVVCSFLFWFKRHLLPSPALTHLKGPTNVGIIVY